MADPCIHEQDWGMVKEVVPSIKEDMRDIVQCQAELKRLINDSQKTLVKQAQVIKDIPKPSTLRFYAVLSGAAGAIIALGVYKLI